MPAPAAAGGPAPGSDAGAARTTPAGTARTTPAGTAHAAPAGTGHAAPADTAHAAPADTGRATLTDTERAAPAFQLVSDAAGGHVRIAPFDAEAHPAGQPLVLPRADLATEIARLESTHPRWVWDDTARWYPPLLAAGVRVERCHDLRLAHAILRTSTLTAASALAMAPPSAWDARVSASMTTRPVPDAAPALTGHAPAGDPSVGRVSDPTQTTLFDPDTFAPASDPAEESIQHRSDPDDGAESTSRRVADASDEMVAEWLAQREAIRGAAEVGRGRGGGGRDARDGGGGRSGGDAHDGGDGGGGRSGGDAHDGGDTRGAHDGGADAGRRVGLLVAAESAGALAAAEMGHAGLPYSAEVHDELLTELLGPRPVRPPGARPGDPDPRPARLEALLHEIRAHLGDPTANPDSPVELLKSLRRAGIRADSTRSWELQDIDHPAIPPLLDYKKRARILTANGWHWSDTWVRGPAGRSRFHPTYLPGGVVTGRWASEGGGALQLPKAVRRAVRADPGHLLVVADAAQLEPRILTALAGDRAMAAAGRDRDLYDGIVASGAVDTRAHAKLGMLGAMYGGTTGESGRMLPRLARAYPAAIAFVEAAARTGEAGGVVSTRLGRTSPRPGDDWLDLRDAAAADGATESARARARQAARSWGRFTRNFVVQGTAAEWALSWIGSIRRRLWALGGPPTPTGPSGTDALLTQRPHLAFFLHDEVMVHTPAALADAVAHELREAAAEAGRLLFGDAPVQFPVTVAIVESYDRAK